MHIKFVMKSYTKGGILSGALALRIRHKYTKHFWKSALRMAVALDGTQR